MSEIFLQILNMSISASYIVLAVLVLRLLLKKAPRWITVVLWGIVAVRLVCPFSFESVLSLIPSAETVSPEIMMDRTPEINSGIPIVNQVINPVISGSFAPDPATSANPLQLWIPTFAVAWIIGIAALLIYAVISYVSVKRKIGTAVLYRDNIYQSETVVSSFVLGLIKPKIYLPFRMSEQNMAHVVAHEQAHIRRRDHLWKPLGFLLLTIHWFNPLMWLAYVLLCRDIELACDEKVVRELDHGARADYSEALLACSVNRRMIAACPLAFGEVGVKERVRSVLNYKKPAFWIILVAIVACIAVAVCFLTNPKSEDQGEPENFTKEQVALMELYPEYFGLDCSNGLDVYVWQMAKNSYSFALRSHSETAPLPGMWYSELMDLPGLSAQHMRAVLDTYDVAEEEIYIVPWQNPISSYIGSYWIVVDGEDPEAHRQEYIDQIREMLFGTAVGDGTGVWESESTEERESTGDAASVTDAEEPVDITLIYSAPTLSYVMSDAPTVEIRNGELYDAEKGTLLGAVAETTLDPTAFDGLRDEFGGHYSEIADMIERDTAVAYEVSPASPRAVDLYYVLLQNDGSTLLVYGHYADGEKNGFIRWIFRLGESI